MGIGLLPLGEGHMGKRVLPAEIIPVIDRQGQSDDVRLAGIFHQQRIGRRAGGAALAGEKLDNRARRIRQGRLQKSGETEGRQSQCQTGRHDGRHGTRIQAEGKLTLP
jgi:hypothetical protein